MDRCVLLTSTPSCVVSPRGNHSGCTLVIAQRSETAHLGVDVNNTHLSMINPLNKPCTNGRLRVKHNCIVMRIDEDSSAYSESFKRVECTNWEYRRVRADGQGETSIPPFNFVEGGINIEDT